MIKVNKYLELSLDIKTELNSIIQNEFGHIPIVKETEWATPDWTILFYLKNKIATFYNIVLTDVTIDDSVVKVAGINNMITPKAFRKNGYASKILKETEYLIFDEFKCELGLLLCADALVPFYSKLNWYHVHCPVYYDQPSGVQLWRANTMLISRNGRINPKKIELNGLPW